MRLPPRGRDGVPDRLGARVRRRRGHGDARRDDAVGAGAPRAGRAARDARAEHPRARPAPDALRVGSRPPSEARKIGGACRGARRGHGRRAPAVPLAVRIRGGLPGHRPGDGVVDGCRGRGREHVPVEGRRAVDGRLRAALEPGRDGLRRRHAGLLPCRAERRGRPRAGRRARFPAAARASLRRLRRPRRQPGLRRTPGARARQPAGGGRPPVARGLRLERVDRRGGQHPQGTRCSGTTGDAAGDPEFRAHPHGRDGEDRDRRRRSPRSLGAATEPGPAAGPARSSIVRSPLRSGGRRRSR